MRLVFSGLFARALAFLLCLAVPGQHPNAHDYDELTLIYNHLESGMIAGGRGAAGLGADSGDTPAEWGRAVHFTADGRPDMFERIDGPGQKTLTHVFWAVGEGLRGSRG